MSVLIFDRDGTLMEHVDYPSHPAQVKLAEGAERLWELREKYTLFLHSNQSGVTRDKMSQRQMESVHLEFLRQLGGNPFMHTWLSQERPGDEGPGSTRKPSPQVINTITTAMGVKKVDVVMIGDSECDAWAAYNAGVHAIIIKSPRNGSLPRGTTLVDNLQQALDML